MNFKNRSILRFCVYQNKEFFLLQTNISAFNVDKAIMTILATRERTRPDCRVRSMLMQISIVNFVTKKAQIQPVITLFLPSKYREISKFASILSALDSRVECARALPILSLLLYQHWAHLCSFVKEKIPYSDKHRNAELTDF